MALDDSDGVGGVAAVRVSEPSLMEQILQYESTGGWMYIIKVDLQNCNIVCCSLVNLILKQP